MSRRGNIFSLYFLGDKSGHSASAGKKVAFLLHPAAGARTKAGGSCWRFTSQASLGLMCGREAVKLHWSVPFPATRRLIWKSEGKRTRRPLVLLCDLQRRAAFYRVDK